jgi:dihydroorotate dehydrogenase (fumarate)
MTMDLSTTYLGFRLPHPFVPGASPLCDDLDTVRRLEDAGAPALIMRSLFEEQIVAEQLSALTHIERYGESTAEASSFLPQPNSFVFGPEEYLNHLRRVREAVGVPVIASLNGVSTSGWSDYPRLIQDVGADALELNIYVLALDPHVSGATVEADCLDAIREVRKQVSIPLAVKLSPFFSSPAAFAREAVAAGADALVLFNRFYQPDIDAANLQAEPSLHLSSPAELPLRLRWVAALSRRLPCSLAVTGGVHSGLDGIKAVMAGADVTQVVSVLLRRGPEHLRVLRAEMDWWLEEHEWATLGELKGVMDLDRCPDPAVYERANYMLMLQSWQRAAAAAGRDAG